MATVRWLATGLFVLAVPTFLVLTNVRIAAMEPRVHEYSFAAYDAEARTGIERPQLDYAAREIIRYFRDDEEFLAIDVMVDGRSEPLFSPREILHMRDVKELLNAALRVHEIAFVYVVAYVAGVFVWGRERSLRRLARELVLAGGFTVVLLGAAAVAAVLGFDRLFREFHVISFSNDFWQLSPARDHLIQMYPSGFWFDVTMAIGLFAALGGALLAAGGMWYLRYDAGLAPAPAAADSEGAAPPPMGEPPATRARWWRRRPSWPGRVWSR